MLLTRCAGDGRPERFHHRQRDGQGNGFTFQSYNTGDMLHSLHRAIYAYNSDQEGWGILVDRAMRCDNSWGKSANDYIKLYKQLLKD